MEVAILVYDGFDELDAIGPYEVFANAGATGADCTPTLVTVTAADRVTASHGLRIEPDALLAAVDPTLLVVPGGGWNDDSDAGARTEAERGTVPDAVARAHRDGVTIASVCTGAMLLERAGLLDGRPAVTHRDAMEELGRSAATVVDARVVDDGDVLTAGGVTSGLDLALYLLEREFGADVAATVGEEMEHDRSTDIHRSAPK